MASSVCETIDVVLKREEILRLICENQPDKRDLVDAVSESRPTIDRALRELEDHELVRRTDGICKPTYTGKIAYELCRDFKSTFETLDETSTELSSLPLDAELDKAIFHTGSVFHPPDYAPYGRIKPLHDDLKSSAEVVAVTEILIPQITRILRQGLEDSVDIELLIGNEVFDVLLENQPETILPHIESGDAVYKDAGVSRYSLLLIDDEILYTVIYSQTNHLSAVVRNTNHQAVQWSKEHISELKKEATLLTA